MAILDDSNSLWMELLRRITKDIVVPVIGQGLLRVDVESEGKTNCLLYDYLAEQILKQLKNPPNIEGNQKFAKACFEYLLNYPNDYPGLRTFLKKKMTQVKLVPDNSLLKLARIKRFNLFLTLTYDNWLVEMIDEIRETPTNVLRYTTFQKTLGKLNNKGLNSFENSDMTLVYHLFGNVDNFRPAFQETDIQDTIQQFYSDSQSEERRNNNIFKLLESSSLLFIGCGFDDWLFRFIFRTISRESHKTSSKQMVLMRFVADSFAYKKEPSKALSQFLKKTGVKVFDYAKETEFVDELLLKMEQNHPQELISL